MLAQWVEKTQPVAVIVDVSAEISQYLRLLGVPAIAIRQHGDRGDSAHLAGYDAAYKLFAPYPPALELDTVPSWIIDKTIYAPGFSQYSARLLTRSAARKQLGISCQQKVVVVLNGRGGGQHSLFKIAAVAVATPEWFWLIVGRVERNCQSLPNNVLVVGWCQDTYVYLKAADVAIASAGHNTVMEIGTATVPLICIPEPRPFDEQQVKAELLAKLGLCYLLTSFPTATSIKSILHKVSRLNVSKWTQIMAADGAKQAAMAISSEVKLLAAYQFKTRAKTPRRKDAISNEDTKLGL
jgi:UDP-N-acetylglucosamine--N-acetylmuramyl-(pentapeptide) pyrophosphoryl-undecaprenol N-acetylglucosamine transferase